MGGTGAEEGRLGRGTGDEEARRGVGLGDEDGRRRGQEAPRRAPPSERCGSGLTTRGRSCWGVFLTRSKGCAAHIQRLGLDRPNDSAGAPAPIGALINIGKDLTLKTVLQKLVLLH